jgi:hypothetical protein
VTFGNTLSMPPRSEELSTTTTSFYATTQIPITTGTTLSTVKVTVGLGCFLNGQRPERGLTLVPEFLTYSETLSSMLVLYAVKRTKH